MNVFQDSLRRIAERVEGTRAVSLVGVDGIPIDTYLAFCEWVGAVRNHFGLRAKQSLPFDAILRVTSTAPAHNSPTIR